MIAVVKLGGSLVCDSSLKDWVSMLAADGAGKAVIVPGGGPFADQVRSAQARWQFDDRTAHRMALLAMEQYAYLIAGLASQLPLCGDIASIRSQLSKGRTPVWLPSKMVLADSSIAASWDVTSDSLAAWLARCLGADSLVLVKLCNVPEQALTINELVDRGIVDRQFASYLEDASFETHVLNKDEIQSTKALLTA